MLGKIRCIVVVMCVNDVGCASSIVVIFAFGCFSPKVNVSSTLIKNLMLGCNSCDLNVST